MLIGRMRAFAISGSRAKPLCEDVIEESVRRTVARAAQRKTTIPNLINPGNAERAERKTSTQIK
jgi:hypothetical protein